MTNLVALNDQLNRLWDRIEGMERRHDEMVADAEATQSPAKDRDARRMELRIQGAKIDAEELKERHDSALAAYRAGVS